MFLNQTAIYSLRAISCLVIADSGSPLKSRDLAERTGIPSHYLSKIMRKMVEANFVVAKKGHGGGFVMAVSPSKLTILDVISAVGFSMEEAPCVFGWHKCSNELPCPLHPVWKQLKNYFTEWSTQTTFEDIRLEYAHADVTKLFADRALANTKNISSARKTVQNS